MNDDACIFCALPRADILAENAHARAVRDKFPIRALHTLVIPRRHVANYFDLNDVELAAIHDLLRVCRAGIEAEDPSVGGFNVGANAGRMAGQKIMHTHVHLIPRRESEEPPPAARA